MWLLLLLAAAAVRGDGIKFISIGVGSGVDAAFLRTLGDFYSGGYSSDPAETQAVAMHSGVIYALIFSIKYLSLTTCSVLSLISTEKLLSGCKVPLLHLIHVQGDAFAFTSSCIIILWLVLVLSVPAEHRSAICCSANGSAACDLGPVQYSRTSTSLIIKQLSCAVTKQC